MAIDVSDIRSNPQDQIAHAARVIGRSKDCRKVFSAIFLGKRRVKTVSEIVNLTKLSRMRVLQEAGKLSDNHIINKTKLDGELAYGKDPFYARNKRKILGLAGDKASLESFPTKTNPKIRTVMEHILLPRKMAKVKSITVDNIDSFARVRAVKLDQSLVPIGERNFKMGLQKILGEEGVFRDWGGEMDDLFSSRLVISSERKNVAFGLKGKGTKGILTPAKMGKQGDQIQRLFRAPADVFLVQYWGQIDESIIEQMRHFAVAKSVIDGRAIYYGVIDGQDTLRILIAYPEYFP